ncbi:sigma-54-dependent Fis family transcriptional regulator [Candidatus Sumerlaeota bacterium]|nr:sigma-54-dependent Fis family transcriptional regulator [Candidatus Sumerlaeota bacterium]
MGEHHRNILIVDDDPGQRSLLAALLERRGYHILMADNAQVALEIFRSKPVHMIISDVRMPGMSGLDMLREIRDQSPDVPVLMVTAYPEIRDAVNSIRDGAVNYLEKPIDLEELQRLIEQTLISGQTPDDESGPDAEEKLPSGVVAMSAAMRSVFRDAAVVAPTDTRILITGESGTGKEVIADFIHAHSARAEGPLVKINCAAFPETLLESELFGHEKGAFTGAAQQRIGRFEEASGGAMFLDEIGEMPLPLQAKLLRVIQDGAFQRLGSNRTIMTNARILAATNRNLEQEVKEKRFREDLLFRLNVFEIYVPPLRERADDIVPLANAFAAKYSNGRFRFSAETISCLTLYDWPGNVRELANAMERACLISRGGIILPEHLPKRVNAAVMELKHEADGVKRSRMEDVERSVILQTLQQNNHNRSETARQLGISRRTLQYKLQHYKEQGFDV